MRPAAFVITGTLRFDFVLSIRTSVRGDGAVVVLVIVVVGVVEVVVVVVGGIVVVGQTYSGHGQPVGQFD